MNKELTEEMLNGMRDVILEKINNPDADKEVTGQLAKVLANCITSNWTDANTVLVSMKDDTRTLVPLSLQALISRNV